MSNDTIRHIYVLYLSIIIKVICVKKTIYLLTGVLLLLAYWQQDFLLSLFNIPVAQTVPDKAESDKQPALPVLTQAVVMRSNDIAFKANGVARARYAAELYPAVAEQVEKVLFQAGQKVHKAQLLVQLEDRVEQLVLRQTILTLKDKQALQQRYQQAIESGGVSQRDLESATQAVNQAQLAIEQAKLAISERKIIAPFTGVVGMPEVDAGDRVQTNTLVTTLDDASELYLDFELPESLFSAMQSGKSQQLQAITAAYPNKTFIAQVKHLASRVNPENASFKVRTMIDNSSAQLRPGMMFQLLWQVSGETFATVPEIALQWGREGPYVWLVREQKAEKIPVQVIRRVAGEVLLQADIQAGEPVVIEGVQRLRPGKEVKLLGEQTR